MEDLVSQEVGLHNELSKLLYRVSSPRVNRVRDPENEDNMLMEADSEEDTPSGVLVCKTQSRYVPGTCGEGFEEDPSSVTWTAVVGFDRRVLVDVYLNRVASQPVAYGDLGKYQMLQLVQYSSASRDLVDTEAGTSLTLTFR